MIDRVSFVNAKESSTELDALAANVRGDGKETMEWGTDSRGREGAQSPRRTIWTIQTNVTSFSTTVYGTIEFFIEFNASFSEF